MHAILTVLCLMLTALPPVFADAPDAAAIIEASFNHYRGKASVSNVEMVIHRPSWARDKGEFKLICGQVVGNLLGLASCWALSFHGLDLSGLAKGAEYAGLSRVIYPDIWLKDVVSANLVVLLPGLVVCLYPAIKAARFTPVEAMAHT